MRFRKIQMLSRVTYRIANTAGNVLLGMMFIFLLMGVICRYVLRYPLAWPEETSMILLVWMVFFGASMALKDRRHVGIIVFVALFPSRVRNAIMIAVDSLMGLFSGYLMVFGWKISVFAGASQTTQYWGIPYFYVYLSVSVGGLLLLIQAFSLILEDIQAVLSSENRELLFGKP